MGRVTRVIDGDTIEVHMGGPATAQTYRVRYIGMDTPELDDLDSRLQALAQQATEKNQELVSGQTVRLERDKTDRDRYGRLLRYVYVDGTFVNGELVRLGYARAKSYPPDTTMQDLLFQLEREARDAGLGLWR